LARQVRYTDEFVGRFRELSRGQQLLVENSLEEIILAADPTSLAHHLERLSYYCNWSHRVRSNLLVVFALSKRTVTFLSTGTHAQSYQAKTMTGITRAQDDLGFRSYLCGMIGRSCLLPELRHLD
jgi:mRNA-degrading endonuclease YafQ of YafQ-DinJ toxin-antitoxin module